MQLTYVLCTRICDCGGIDEYASKIFEIQNGQNWLLKYQKLQKISKVYNTALTLNVPMVNKGPEKPQPT